MRNLLIAALIAALLSGCAPTLSLEPMPLYDAAEVNSQWEPVIVLESIYRSFLDIRMVRGPTPIEQQQLESALDRYTYWLSVAKVYLFHSQWSKATPALEQAKDGLTDAYRVLEGLSGI